MSRQQITLTLNIKPEGGHFSRQVTQSSNKHCLNAWGVDSEVLRKLGENVKALCLRLVNIGAG